MQEMNIDVLCFTGHKGLLGPQGIGGLCVREGMNIRPLKSGGSGVNTFSKNSTYRDANSFRSWNFKWTCHSRS